MSLPALELTLILSSLEFSILPTQAKHVFKLPMLARTTVIEVALVLIFILELYLAHVVQTAISKRPSLTCSVLCNS